MLKTDPTGYVVMIMVTVTLNPLRFLVFLVLIQYSESKDFFGYVAKNRRFSWSSVN